MRAANSSNQHRNSNSNADAPSQQSGYVYRDRGENSIKFSWRCESVQVHVPACVTSQSSRSLAEPVLDAAPDALRVPATGSTSPLPEQLYNTCRVKARTLPKPWQHLEDRKQEHRANDRIPERDARMPPALGIKGEAKRNLAQERSLDFSLLIRANMVPLGQCPIRGRLTPCRSFPRGSSEPVQTRRVSPIRRPPQQTLLAAPLR